MKRPFHVKPPESEKGFRKHDSISKNNNLNLKLVEMGEAFSKVFFFYRTSYSIYSRFFLFKMFSFHVIYDLLKTVFLDLLFLLLSLKVLSYYV